jgi:RibD C-terminal domain
VSVPGTRNRTLRFGELAQSLLAAGLVDKIGVKIRPILLGSGIPTLREFGHRIRLTLAECRTLEGGRNLGAKQLYFYPGMKVISTNGKVTDVQRPVTFRS